LSVLTTQEEKRIEMPGVLHSVGRWVRRRRRRKNVPKWGRWVRRRRRRRRVPKRRVW